MGVEWESCVFPGLLSARRWKINTDYKKSMACRNVFEIHKQWSASKLWGVSTNEQAVAHSVLKRYIQITNIMAKRSQQRIQIQMPPIQIQTPPGHATNNVCSEKLCGFWVTSASKKLFHTANPPLVEGSLSSTPATQPLSHSNNRVASAATQPRWVAKWLGWKFPPLRAQSHIQPSRHENQTVQPKGQRCQGSGLFAFAFSLLWLLGIPRWLLWTWGLFVLFLAFLRRQGFLVADGYYVHLLDKAQGGCSPIGRTEWWECFKRGFEDGGLIIPGQGSSWRESTKVRSNISMAPTRSSWSIWSAIWARSHIVKPVSLAATWSAKAAAVSLFAGFLGAPLTTAGEGFWNPPPPPPPPRELYKIQLRPPQLEKSTPGQLLEGLLARDARWESQARNIGDQDRWLGCRAEGSPQFQVQIHQD